ncbi:UNVERIFIED_CONTAM: hypothetical protein FKN15_027656 [Acipenser sinensis]
MKEAAGAPLLPLVVTEAEAPPLLAAVEAEAPPLLAAKAAGAPPLLAVKAAGAPPLLAAKAAGAPPLHKFNRLCYQSQVPLPLPKQLVVFSLGDWRSYSRDTSITVEVSVSPDVTPQKIGRLSAETRCLVWEGEWRLDLLTAAMEQADRGVFGKLLLTVNGQGAGRLKPVLPAALQCPPGNGSIWIASLHPSRWKP